MRNYLRTRPLVFASALVAIFVAIFLSVVATVTIRNSTATGYYSMIAERFHDRPDLHAFESNIGGELAKRLFGVTEAEGMAMLEACSHGKWVLLGIVRVSDGGCPYDELARCDIGDKSLVARRAVWTRSDYVKFLACTTGHCPDFAVDVATEDPPAACPSPFELQVNKRD